MIMHAPNTASQLRPRNVAAETNIGEDSATLHHIRLAIRDDKRFGASVNARCVWLIPACGCLLQPHVGDLVLASVIGEQGYIVTVLEQANPDGVTEISAPGDLRLALPNGRLNIMAAQGMLLDSGPSLEIRATRWSAKFQQAQVYSQTMKVCGQTMQSQWHSRTDTCDGTHLAIAARGETHLGSSVRRVKGHDESSAQSLRQLVERDWSVLADTASVEGRREAVLNAASVQIG